MRRSATRTAALLARGLSTSTAAPPPAPADKLRQAFGHCVDQVRTHDYENYVWCTQLPKELRAPIITLRAFAVETALIERRAKSDMLVMMRFQWWRDALNSAYKGRAPDQPTMTALADVISRTNVTRYRLQRMLTAREEETLRAEAPPSLEALETMAEGTSSQLLYLQLEAADIKDAAADHAASHVGKAAGLAATLRGTGAAAQRGRSYLPADLCAAHGIDPDDLMRGEATPGLRDVVFAIAAAAKGHLDAARGHLADVPPAARPLLLPAVSAGLYLDALEKANFNVFDPELARGGFSPLRYALQLKWTMMRGRY